MKCSFQHFSVPYEFEMKTYCVLKGVFQKVMTHKLSQNANFEVGGTTIQIGILHVLLNVLSISLLSRVHDKSGYFQMQKELSCHLTF